MDVNGTARNLQVGCWQCLLPLASDVGVGLGACSACAGEGDTTRCGRGRGGEECSQTVYKLRRISHLHRPALERCAAAQTQTLFALSYRYVVLLSLSQMQSIDERYMTYNYSTWIITINVCRCFNIMVLRTNYFITITPVGSYLVCTMYMSGWVN